MHTITFYSYKGGVGRTLALANIALYLSKFGLNVCLIDFDLEAPGLHHKLTGYLKKIQINLGLVDLIYDYAKNKQIPQSLNDYFIEIVPPTEVQGSIHLLPAGNVKSSDYWQKLASIDWHKLFLTEEGNGILYILELKELIKKQLKPDFLLIDSRTGITEMSGLCTSVLPEDVVFLITNNMENFEGAGQIYRSIKQVETLPRRQPINIIFALTRVPYPENKDIQEREEKIVKEIISYLRDIIKDSSFKLRAQDFCILHSDRELELLESLRLSQIGNEQSTPLLQDYIRLFSKVVPENIVKPRMDKIFNEIITPLKLLEDPERIQKELEGIAASYPHQKSLETLIEFYILRNTNIKIILGKYHELWDTFGIQSEKLLEKYCNLFLNFQPSFNEFIFKPEIIEKYLKNKKEFSPQIEKKLGDEYLIRRQYDFALNHFKQLLYNEKDKITPLSEILEIYTRSEHFKKKYDEITKIFSEYGEIIDKISPLLAKKIRILYNFGKMEDVKNIIANRNVETDLMELDPILFYKIMIDLGKQDEMESKLTFLLEIAIKKGSRQVLNDIGSIFYKTHRRDEFVRRLTKERMPLSLINDLDEKFLRHEDIAEDIRRATSRY